MADSVSQVDGVSEMALACQLCGSVGVGSEKDQWPLFAVLPERKMSPSSHHDARHFISSLTPLVPFKILPWCWSLE